MKLAIIVGHTQAEQGSMARWFSNVSEYAFNKEIASEIQRHAGVMSIRTNVFLRDGMTWPMLSEKVKEFCGDDGVCVELHCNAEASGKAKGTETLYDETPAESEYFAKCVHKAICDGLVRGGLSRGIKLRSLHDADPTNDRGARNLHAINVPSCLVEPAFWSTQSEAELLFGRKKEYSQSILRGVLDYYMGLGG